MAEVEPAETGAHRDIGERERVAAAERPRAELALERVQAARDLLHLPLGPARAPLVRGPLALRPNERARVDDPVGERLPAAHLDALAVSRRDELADRRHPVEELADHARVVERGPVLEHQDRHLAEWIEVGHRRVGRPGILDLPREFDPLFRGNDARLARERACARADEFQAGSGHGEADSPRAAVYINSIGAFPPARAANARRRAEAGGAHAT